jgi:uncharacterized membrane protein YukC
MSYDLRGMQTLEGIKEADRPVRLALLIAAAELEELYLRYEFSLEPENLYYDILGRVRVKRRDCTLPGGKDRRKEFLRRYQALIGYVMDGARTYEDYLYGEPELLTAKEPDAEFFEPETVQEEKKLLVEAYESCLEHEKKCMKKVERRTYERLVRACTASAIMLVLLIAAFLYI